MKLVIQIPCYNEEERILDTLRELPKEISGIDEIIYLIVDDGSTDATTIKVEGHDKVHVLKKNHTGLRDTFFFGMTYALNTLEADYLVNTDADNQYSAADIARLMDVLIKTDCGIVIGERDIERIDYFSRNKKLLQRIGSTLISNMSGQKIKDVTSGFRAYNREAMQLLCDSSAEDRVCNDILLRLVEALGFHSGYTYTQEVIFKASAMGIRIKTTDISVNGFNRRSRLSKSSLDYIMKIFPSIIHSWVKYRKREGMVRYNDGNIQEITN